MPQPIKFPFPKRGVNRNWNREDQNGMQQGFGSQLLPETTWNASNVLPYDRWDRLRLGQRPGTARLFAALAATPIMALGSDAVALDPSQISPTNVILSEQFNYTNGVTLDSTGNWTTYSALPNGSAGTRLPQLVIGNPPGDVTGFNTTSYALYSGVPLQIGRAYSISVDFVFDTNTTTYTILARANGNNAFSGVALQFTTSATGGAGTWTLFLNQTGSTGITSAAYGAFFAVNGTKFTLTLQFLGDAITGYVNGTQIVSATSTFGNTFQGWGWGLSAPGGATGNTVSNVIVKSSVAGVYRQVFLAAVANASVYVGNPTALSLATGGSGIINPGVKPSAAFGQGNWYIVDGSTIQKLVLSSGSVSALVATAGTLPSGPTIAAVYRDRLILAAPVAFPQNFYMSRVGTHTDFDYSQSDPAAAFAGSASTAGHIGDPINALMPFNDDVMLIGGDHHLWQINGDPADGGSIDLISDAIGVLGPNAWTKDPLGNIYFLGTGGLFKTAPGGKPELLSGQTFNQFFSGIDRANNYITLVWDRDRQGMYIFVTPTQSGPATHLWYDSRNGGLWPVSYPNTHGPISAIVYDGTTSSDRAILLGGRGGLIQKVQPTALDDDGTAISCIVSLGPVQASPPSGDAIVSAMDVDLGENFGTDATTVINANWTLKGGKTAFEVTEGTPRRIAGGTFTAPGRQQTRRQRLRGGWFAVEFSNSTIDTYFSLERVVLHVEGQGKQR